ncbi:MAG: hypothetical protein ACRDMV_14960, partial [Streptosporangiales bacterium]
MSHGDVAATATEGTEARRPRTARPRRRGHLLEREGPLAAAMLLPSILYIIGLVGVPFCLAVAY